MTEEEIRIVRTNLPYIRKICGLNQEELAELMDMTRTSLYRLENLKQNCKFTERTYLILVGTLYTKVYPNLTKFEINLVERCLHEPVLYSKKIMVPIFEES